MKIFLMNTEGKLKPNIIVAEDIVEALVILYNTYPEFTNVHVDVTEIVNPQLVF